MDSPENCLRDPVAAFSEAFLADEPGTRERLRHALEDGDRLDHGKILDAVLGWPDEAPSAEVVALIRSNIGGSTAYHVFMDAARWDRGAEVGREGVAFVERLREMVGEAPGIFSLRASFHEQAGDLAAAVRDLERELERELERTPADDWRLLSAASSMARFQLNRRLGEMPCLRAVADIEPPGRAASSSKARFCCEV